MNIKKKLLWPVAFSACAAYGLDADFGADFRLRQEIMNNVPGLPGGGLLNRAEASKQKNQWRFRTRVWGDVKFGENLHIYSRLANAPRWNVNPHSRAYEFPDELFLDNLYLEGTGFWDGLVDFVIGRQDTFGAGGALYGLSRIFSDTTPGDGSRSFYSDMARVTIHATDESKIDGFVLYNSDRNKLRWGTGSSRNRALCGLGGADPEADEFGAGVVWSSSIGSPEAVPYQLFSVYKKKYACHYGDGKHPGKDIATFGARFLPQLTGELSLELEGMAQAGETTEDDFCKGWSAFAAVDYHPDVGNTVKPYAQLSCMYMSGDEDTAGEYGGNSAWDPLWNRAASPSEMMAYGSTYGMCWWSNLIYPKLSGGVKFGKRHSLNASTGPMFAAKYDGLGQTPGADGSRFMGLLSQVRYDFPLLTAPADATGLKRLEIFGHLLAEMINPGDYYATSRPAWFLRWEVMFKF